MNYAHNRKLQQAARDFFNIDHWIRPHAVTLTLKQGVHLDNGIIVPLTHDLAFRNLHLFISMLNKKIFGKAAERYGKRLRVIAVLEGGGRTGKRLHFHVVIDCPHDFIGSFPELIRTTWLATEWGYNRIDIKTAADKGWVNYMTKFRDKANVSDSIDWYTYYNP